MSGDLAVRSIRPFRSPLAKRAFVAPIFLVVIDGSHRRACAEPTVKALAPTGMLVVDNADFVRLAGGQGIPCKTASTHVRGGLTQCLDES